VVFRGKEGGGRGRVKGEERKTRKKGKEELTMTEDTCEVKMQERRTL